MLGAYWLSVSMCTFACPIYTVDGEHRRILHILHKWLISAFCLETGGTDGLFAQKTMEITEEALSSYKNQGGYDMLGRTKDQIRTKEQVNGAMASCQALKLDALVIIGGMQCYKSRDSTTLYICLNNIKCQLMKVSHPILMLLNLLKLLPRQSAQQRYIGSLLLYHHLPWTHSVSAGDWFLCMLINWCHLFLTGCWCPCNFEWGP